MKVEFEKCILKHKEMKKTPTSMLPEPYRSKLIFSEAMYEILNVFQSNSSTRLAMISEMAILLRVAEHHPDICKKVWGWNSKISNLCTEINRLLARYSISLNTDPIQALFESNCFDMVPVLVELGVIHAGNMNHRYQYGAVEGITLMMASSYTGCYQALQSLLLINADSKLEDSRGWTALEYGMEKYLSIAPLKEVSKKSPIVPFIISVKPTREPEKVTSDAKPIIRIPSENFSTMVFQGRMSTNSVGTEFKRAP